MVVNSPAVHFDYSLFDFFETKLCNSAQLSFLDTYNHDHALHIWRIWDSLCSFSLSCSRSHRLRGRDVVTAFTGRLSCMQGMNTNFEGYFFTTLISMYSSYPSCFFSGHQRLMPHGFCFFLRLAFQDISGWLFYARKVHQKKGFILSSISALRLLLHVHI